MGDAGSAGDGAGRAGVDVVVQVLQNGVIVVSRENIRESRTGEVRKRLIQEEVESLRSLLGVGLFAVGEE